MIALIPFRKDSKRIRDKNIKDFFRKPLFKHTVEQAIASDSFSKTIIATDYAGGTLYKKLDIYISKLDYFFREPVSDTQPATEYIRDVIKNQKLDEKEDICLLQPTCPLRDVTDITEAIAQYERGSQPTLVSVEEIGSAKKLYRRAAYSMASIIVGEREAEGYKFDDILYRRNSSIYIFNVGYFLEHNTIFEEFPNYYVMPASRSIDINTHEDLELATAIKRGE